MNPVFDFGPLSASRLRWLLLAAFGWRAFVSALTPVPSEDGVNYLWMADRFAELRPQEAFSEVFPPLFPMLVAPGIALGLDPFRAAQIVTCLCGVFALWLGVRVCERLVDGSAGIAVWVGMFAPLPTRLGGEIYSEPLFVLLGALVLHRIYVQRRFFEAGLWCGFAFWVRDEAAVLAAVFALTQGRHGLKVAAGAAFPVVCLVLWRFTETGIWSLSPKAEFSTARIDRELGGRDVLGQVLQLPWLWFEAWIVTGVAALVGCVVAWRRREVRPLLWVVVLGGALICAFVARRRFWISWFCVVLPLAVLGLRRLPDRVRNVLMILLLISNILLSLRIQAHDRIAERRVGEYLGEISRPSEGIAGDMTRVQYFAGRRPLPPRKFSVDDLIERASQPGIAWVVLGGRRDTAGPVREALADRFAVYDLPAEIRTIADVRGIVVLRRRP